MNTDDILCKMSCGYDLTIDEMNYISSFNGDIRRIAYLLARSYSHKPHYYSLATVLLHNNLFDINHNIINIRDPWIIALTFSKINILKYYLLNNPQQDINITDFYNDHALLLAMIKQDIDFMNILISKGANVNHKDNNNNSLLHSYIYAKSNKVKKNIIDILLEQNIDINIKNDMNVTAQDLLDHCNCHDINLENMQESHTLIKDPGYL